MKLILIAAHDPDLVIGRDGELPWHYREDMLYFKEQTMGSPVLMGRGVFEEVGEKPLPGRRNVVLTRTRSYPNKNVEIARSIDEALERLKNEKRVFVIGGGDIYKAMLAMADFLYITEINKSYGGDTFFPEYRDEIGKSWKEIWRDDHPEFSFVRYERVE
jgi:dihydrofolate reductase